MDFFGKRTSISTRSNHVVAADLFKNVSRHIIRFVARGRSFGVMRCSSVHFERLDPGKLAQYEAGVSLHGHTLHSRENLEYIVTAAHKIPGLAAGMRQLEQRYITNYGQPMDFREAWWTPPLGPVEAVRVERRQIEAQGLRAIVSLTDHDNIEAANSPAVTGRVPDFPISVEW